MLNYEKFYKELNLEQREAVDTIDGPVLVLAGPGTGKTQLLSVRAANIIRQKHALPENILILTYTNIAAKTMKERLSKIIGVKGYDVRVSTFHSFANSIILDSEEAINYIQERIQLTDIENIKVIEYILDHSKGLTEIRPFTAPYTYVDEIQKRLSELKREGITPAEFISYVEHLEPDGIRIEDKHIPRLKALAIVYEQYEKLKEGKNKEVFDERGRYDYDDMIIVARTALDKEATLKKRYLEQFNYIMVDEFQDTNGAQLKFLFSLTEGSHTNLCCVGDDDQSIYRFQGASTSNFKELKNCFKGLKIISLKNNYRSTKEIIEISQNLIKELPNAERTKEKELVPIKDFKNKSIEYWEFTTEEEEMRFLLDKIEAFKKEILSSKELRAEERRAPYNNIVILVRKRSVIPRIVDAFLQAGIPYATDGKEDIRAELRVRQMLDVLEIVSIEPENFRERDTALYKILISDYFEIPHKDILSFINRVNKKKKDDYEITLVSELFNDKNLTGPLDKAVRIVEKLLKEALFKPAHTVLMDYIEDAGLYRFILEKYDKNEIMKIRELRSLGSFINMVKDTDFSKPGASLKDFIDDLRTRKEHNMPIQGELVTMTQNGVRIFTAHGSKGQEFHSVIIPFCLQDENWPIRHMSDKIPLPPELLKSSESVDTKERLKELQFYDELRLFYVAVSRAKSNVLFTASPRGDKISSSFLHRLGIEAKEDTSKEIEKLGRFFKKTDLKDPFIGTEEVLNDLVRDMSLNPTSLNNYIYCKRKFLYDNVLLLPGPKKQSLIFGNAVHAGLEKLYRYYMQKKTFPDFQFFKDSFLEALKFQGPEKAVELRSIEQFEGLKPFYNKMVARPVMPLGLENRMPINIDGIGFTGKYDKLEMEDEESGLVRVVDYKTGRADKHTVSLFNCRSLEDESCDEYFRQLVCYKLLYERDNSRKDKHLTVSHGVLTFVEPAKEDSRKYGVKKGEPTEFKIELTDDMVDEIAGIIKNVWRGIQELHFEKLTERDKKKCPICDFDYICWG